MHSAIVNAWGEAPKYQQTADLTEPEQGWTQVKVEATGVHQVVRARAAGKHYSSNETPHIPGVDGVGTLPGGQRVYFSTFTTGGSFSEYVNVPERRTVPLPDGAVAIQIAAFVNPGLSSWMALKARTNGLPEDFTILIMGATSASGRLAVSMARSCGAKKIIGLARSAAALAKMDLNERVVLADPANTTDFSTLGDVDVVLDYVYGPVTVHLFQSLKSSRPTQYVHIGSLAAQEIDLPGSVLRSKNLTIRGAGPGAYTMADIQVELPDLIGALVKMEPQAVDVKALKDVESEWTQAGTKRVVFVP